MDNDRQSLGMSYIQSKSLNLLAPLGRNFNGSGLYSQKFDGSAPDTDFRKKIVQNSILSNSYRQDLKYNTELTSAPVRKARSQAMFDEPIKDMGWELDKMIAEFR